MADFPIRTKKQISGDDGVRAVMKAVPAEWIVRELDRDYGIDIEVEVVDGDEKVRGRLAKAQVKAVGSINWTANDDFKHSLSDSTINYWRGLPTPVLIFVYDRAADEIYWAREQDAILTGDEAAGVRIHKHPVDWTEVASHIDAMNDRFSARALIARAHVTVGRYETKLDEDLDYDQRNPMDHEEEAKFRRLYADLLDLRQALGLGGDIIQWGMWKAMSEKAHPDIGELSWGIHDLACGYLRPLVDEIREGVVTWLNQNPDTPHLADVRFAFGVDEFVLAEQWAALTDDEMKALVERAKSGAVDAATLVSRSLK